MKSRKSENLNRIFPGWKTCHSMKKPIHIRVQIIGNLNSGMFQNKKIKVDIYWKRKYTDVLTVRDVHLQKNVKGHHITKNFM